MPQSHDISGPTKVGANDYIEEEARGELSFEEDE